MAWRFPPPLPLAWMYAFCRQIAFLEWKHSQVLLCILRQAVEAPFFECVAFWRLWSAYPFEGLLKQGSILCGLLFERILSLLRVSQGCLKALLERTPSVLNRILSVIRPCWTVGLYERTLVFNKIERPSCKAWLNRILSLLKLYLQGSYVFSLFVVTGARPF